MTHREIIGWCIAELASFAPGMSMEDRVEAVAIGWRAYNSPIGLDLWKVLHPIEDEIEDIWKDVPESEWSKLPTDLSENLDHYLYGTLTGLTNDRPR